MLTRMSVLAACFVSFTGVCGAVWAETLAGRVDSVNVVAGEIEIDGVRYKLGRSTRDRNGGRPELSRYQRGDGVIYKPGSGQVLLSIEKPATGIDLPPARSGGS